MNRWAQLLAGSSDVHRALARLLWIVAAIGVVVTSSLLLFVKPILHDTAWIVHCIRLMTEGVHLYEDIYAINPPQHFMLVLPSAWLAKAAGLSGPNAFLVYVLGLVVLSLVLCRQGLGLLLPDNTTFRRIFFFLLCVCFVPLQERFMGHRDPTMMVLAMPYLLVCACRASGVLVPRGLAIGCGVLAGLGFAIKPFYLAVWVALLLYLRVGRRLPWRDLAPENIAIFCYQAIYGIIILLVFPAYIGVSWNALHLYDAYHNLIKNILCKPAGQATLWILLPVCLFMPRIRPRLRALAGVLLAALCGFWVEILLQHKGWPYHQLPAKAANILLLATVLWGILELRPRLRRAAGVLCLTMACLFTAGLGTLSLKQVLYYRGLDRGIAQVFEGPVSRLVDRYARGGAIAVFSTEVCEAWPLWIYQDTRWPSRFFHHWLLPGLYPKARATVREGTSPLPQPPWTPRPLREQPPAERLLKKAVMQDLLRDPPDLLLVTTHFWNMPEGFDYIKYFSIEEGFSVFFRHYKKVASVGFIDAYARQPLKPRTAALAEARRVKP